MDTMKFVWMLVAMIWAVAPVDGKAALRRKPKIYNALITTDENLVQSRAYPVIQPTIHESGIAHYAVAPYTPYGFYNPHLLRFGQPIVPNLPPKDQMSPALAPTPFPPQVMARPLASQWFPGYPPPQTPAVRPGDNTQLLDAQIPPTAPAFEQQTPTRQPPTMLMNAPAPEDSQKDPSQVEAVPSEPLPIPLNQHGLPPSLIPLKPQYPQPPPSQIGAYGQPLFLPPYGFQQFPPIFQRSLPELRQPYLPHYGYVSNGPQFPLSNAIPTDKAYPPPAPTGGIPLPQQVPQLPPPEEEAQATPAIPKEIQESAAEPQSAFESIKNGSKSEDSNVPDVPPPPIPSGAKPMQS